MDEPAPAPDPNNAMLRTVAGLALASGLFFCVGLGDTSVVNADEAIYHGIAERMVETGNWLTLDYRGEPRIYDTFLNAPLHYWIRASAIELFGNNGWTLRGLSALSAVLAVLATFGLGARLLGREAGLVAGVVLATTYQFVYLHGARTGELDTLVTAEIVFAAWTFLRAVEDRRSFLPHHLAIAALVMTKAPLALVPLGCSLFWFLEFRESRSQFGRYVLSGLAVLPLAVAWHGLQTWMHTERVAGVVETLLGQAGGNDPDVAAKGLLGNLAYYASVVLYGAFPYSVAFPFALAAAAMRPRAAVMYPTLFLGALVLFFGLVAKHYPWYILPLYPFLAILLADFLRDLVSRGLDHPLAWGLGFIAAALIVLDVGLWDTNPFAQRALVFPMDTTARRLGPLAPLALFLTIGAFFTAGLVAARKQPELRGPVLGMALLFLLVTITLPRALAPLRFVGYQSDLARTHAEVRATQARGEALALPLRLEAPSLQIARFYFGDDFELVPAKGRDGRIDLMLYPPGHWAVLDQSIGRKGLESRLKR